MPQQLSQTVRNTFNKGLLTEFSALNFPTEASIDELNCDLRKDGSRRKRLGLSYETGYSLSDESYSTGLVYSTGRWENVGEEPEVEYLVVQIGSILRFYQKGGSTPLSNNVVPTSDSDSTTYTVNLESHKKVGGAPSQERVSVASIKGRLVVVSPEIEAFYIEKDTSDNSFSTTTIDFKIRDFSYQKDRATLTASAANPPDVSHQYDTKNCGWVDTKGEAALTTYTAANSAYPPLILPWYSGKDSSGVFSVTEWEKIYAGNTLIVNGHYVLDLFNQDRDTASGLSGVPSTTISERFSAVEAFAGRVFFSGADDRVYFSPILEDMGEIGNFYQVNDPTSEDISDLLATDGGWVNLPEAVNIKELHTFGSALLIFAENGVWKLSGVDEVFRADEFAIYRITQDGLAQKGSFTSGENGVPFWWSRSGVHTLEVTDQGGFVEVNLSVDTIQTFWLEIDSEAKTSVQAQYDGVNDRVMWFYPNNDESIPNKLNRVLNLDIRLKAFYPWQVSDKAVGSPAIIATSFWNGAGSGEVDLTVVDSNGDTVVDSNGDTVIVTRTQATLSSSAVKLLVINTNGNLTFADFTDTTFLDWEDADYSAYAESAYDFKGDLARRKNAPYITVFMGVTEGGWLSNGDGTYTPTRESSLKVTSFWDSRKTSSTAAQEAYRLKYPLVVDASDLSDFDYPDTLVTTRLKLRGRGRFTTIRFEGQTGKDFNLLGWETLNAINPGY